MRVAALLLPMTILLAAALAWSGCDEQHAGSGPCGTLSGVVLLGPRCPVERPDRPCPDLRPAGVDVVISMRPDGGNDAAGTPVARTVTDRAGRFRVAVPPGIYAVTARAGMSCQVVAAVVTVRGSVPLALRCDTGIR